MNWGHGIAIGFGLFVAYILYFVVASFGHDQDLVAEDYYYREVHFQEQIEQTENGLTWQSEIQAAAEPGGIVIQVKAASAKSLEGGTVKLFRPSNAALDLTLPLGLDSAGEMRIPSELLKPGRYQLQFQLATTDGAIYLEKTVHIR